VQLDLLDHYAGAEALAARVRDAHRTWRSATDTLNTLQTNAEQSRDRRTLLEYQLGELSELAIAPGEYEELHDRYRRMSKSQTFRLVSALR
jgi:DNA repair protein RecN (Recombination protein N)